MADCRNLNCVSVSFVTILCHSNEKKTSLTASWTSNLPYYRVATNLENLESGKVKELKSQGKVRKFMKKKVKSGKYQGIWKLVLVKHVIAYLFLVNFFLFLGPYFFKKIFKIFKNLFLFYLFLFIKTVKWKLCMKKFLWLVW